MTLLDQSIIPYTYSQLRVDFGRISQFMAWSRCQWKNYESRSE